MESRLDAVRLDGGYVPTTRGRERRSQLLLTDGVRASIGNSVAEAQHIQDSTAFSDRGETRYIFRPLGGVEGVEESAVEHGLKFSSQTVQMERVSRGELGLDATVAGLLPGDGQRRLRDVNAQNRKSQGGDEKSVLAGAAAGIEHC